MNFTNNEIQWASHSIHVTCNSSVKFPSSDMIIIQKLFQSLYINFKLATSNETGKPRVYPFLR